jgi:hypothetical protein
VSLPESSQKAESPLAERKAAAYIAASLGNGPMAGAARDFGPVALKEKRAERFLLP